MKKLLLLTIALMLFCAPAAQAGTVSYSYDDAGRLKKADYGAYAIHFSYDAAGNLLTQKIKESGILQKCTLEKSGVSAAGLDLLRNFRDQRLSQAVPELVKSYYHHGPELVRMVNENAGLKKALRAAIRDNLGTIRALLNSGSATINQSQVRKITALMRQFKAQAGAELQRDLERVAQELGSGELGEKIGLTVKQ